MDTQVPIVKPIKGKNTPNLGPVTVMAAPKPDLTLLHQAIGFKQIKAGSLFTGELYVGNHNTGGVSLAGPFLGAPHAAMLMETLVSRGACKLIFMGWCGSLESHVRIGDLVVPTGGIIDEGTSRHYGKSTGGKSHPSDSLLHQLRDILTQDDISFHEGLVWTTDGAFRETRDKIIRFRKRKALAVEMEMSALFSVARFLGVEMAGVLVVSDELIEKKWNPGFRSEVFKKGRRTAAGVVAKLCRVLTDG